MNTDCYAIVSSDYEGMTVVAVYESLRDAESVLEQVKSYCADGAPEMPGLEVSDKVFSKREREYKKWREGHPLGFDNAYFRDSFYVMTLPFHQAATP